MGIFSRMLKIGEAGTHSLLDKFEDPIKMSDQGIRDLKKDLAEAIKSLAEVKAIAIRHGRRIEELKRNASDYEKKAMLLLQRAKDGGLDPQQAERLALEALNKKGDFASQAMTLKGEKQHHDQMVAKMQANVQTLKDTVRQQENQLTTLKARYKTAQATAKLNKQISQIDSSGTMAMLEKMKEKVDESEALAQAYGDVSMIDQSVDSEIDKALEGSGSIAAQDSLAALKAKMGMDSA